MLQFDLKGIVRCDTFSVAPPIIVNKDEILFLSNYTWNELRGCVTAFSKCSAPMIFENVLKF